MIPVYESYVKLIVSSPYGSLGIYVFVHVCFSKDPLSMHVTNRRHLLFDIPKGNEATVF